MLIAHFEKVPLRRVWDIDEVTSYVNKRRDDGIMGQTIKRELTVLKAGAKIALRWGLIRSEPNDWPQLKSDPPNVKRAGKFREPELLQQWFALLKRDARDEVMFDVLTGVRAWELKRILVDWFRPVDRGPTRFLLELPGSATKSRRPRTIGISDRAMAIVDQRLKDGLIGDGGRVFSAVDHRKHRDWASRELKLEHNITLRDLRHTYATISLWRGGDAEATMRALGHSDLSMTQRYQHSTVERIAQAGAVVDAEFKDTGALHRKMLQAGEADRTAKLTPDEVREVLARRKEGAKLKAIAEDFGVHLSTISLICRGKTYASVDRESGPENEEG